MIELKQYDTARKIRQQLFVNGAPVNLSGASVALLWGATPTAETPGAATERVANIVDVDDGIVEYQPVAEDVATPGLVEAEWKITFGGTRLTIPTTNRIVIKIFPALA